MNNQNVVTLGGVESNLQDIVQSAKQNAGLQRNLLASTVNGTVDGLDFSWKERCHAAQLLSSDEFLKIASREWNLFCEFLGSKNASFLFEEMKKAFTINLGKMNLPVHQYRRQILVALPNFDGKLKRKEIIKHIFCLMQVCDI